MLAYFQSQQSSLGNSINIAGKNRYLTANVLLQIEKYLYGLSSDASQLKNAMSILESNILTLKQGGKISGMDIKPLPSNLLALWNSVDSTWNVYKTYVTNNVLTLPPEATSRTMNQSLGRNVIESMASTLIGSSDKLVTLLGQQTDKNTLDLMLLQILFAILIIGIMVLILYLVKRMLRPIFDLTQATSKVKKGNLDVTIQKYNANDELSILSDSFNSMVQSIKNHITKQNQLTSELRKLNEQLEQKDKLKDEFINIAAHELRTPIQPILGLSEVIRSRRSISDNSNMGREGGEEEFLDIVIRNAKRLQSLSENILDITKIESGTLKLNKEKFNINQKIRNVINDIKLRENVIQISFDDSKIDPILVEADSLRIYQVMSNLLTNAVKSTKKRSIGGGNSSSNRSSQDDCSSTITVSTAIKKSIDTYGKNNNNSSISSHDDEVIISIRDKGTGIDSDIQDKLFSKFVTKSEAGSGLGLYISKGIVEAHGGRICAENNADGNGATFTFSLPVL